MQKKLIVSVFLAVATLLGALVPNVLHAAVQYGTRESDGRTIYFMRDPDFSATPPTTGTVATGLAASCVPSHATAPSGQTITWLTSVSGGSGSYLYTWSGTDGLVGNTQTVQKVYATNGEKRTTVSVTSGGQTITVPCGAVQIGPIAPASFVPAGLGASCYAMPERALPGETVNWISLVSGITASTTYEWDGSNGLTGNRPVLTKTYATSGNKFAFLTVTNGPLRTVAACTNFVAVGPKTSAAPRAPALAAEPLGGICAPSAARATVGESIFWQAAAVGGTGSYRYSWSGDDNLQGSLATTTKRYETAGLKKASVAVSSGEKAKTLECATVEIVKEKGLLAAVFSSGLGISLLALGGLALVIIAGIYLVRRKREREQKEEEESDFVGAAPAH